MVGSAQSTNHIPSVFTVRLEPVGYKFVADDVKSEMCPMKVRIVNGDEYYILNLKLPCQDRYPF